MQLNYCPNCGLEIREEDKIRCECGCDFDKKKPLAIDIDTFQFNNIQGTSDKKLMKDENGKLYVRYYNNKNKFWVEVTFTGQDNEEEIKDILTKIAIENMLKG